MLESVVEPTDTSSLKLISDFAYDNFGNVLTKTVSGPSIIARPEVTNTYDAQGRGPITVANALGHSQTLAYYWAHGGLQSRTDVNGLVTSWTYDPFARPATENRPDGTRTTTTYNPCAACVPGAVYSVSTTNTVVASGANVSPPQRAYFDTLGRSIVTAHAGLSGQDIYAETVYDALGRVGYKSANYFAADLAIRWTQFDYDALNRTVKTTHPDDSIATKAYNGRTTSETNDNGVTNSRKVNSQGKIESITDAQGTADASSVTYAYDNWGNLVKTTDAMGNVITISYDRLGRRTGLLDPDIGTSTVTFVVNALGEVTSQTDAKGQVTTNTYDPLSRLVRRQESDLDSSFFYEKNAAGATCAMAVGKLCEATTTNGYFRRLGYDSLGRLGSQTVHLDVDYTATWGFDAAGRLSSQTYPATTAAFPTAASVSYTYSASGLLQSIAGGGTTYWTRNEDNADENIKTETYGNGVVGARTYDESMGRIRSLQAGPSGNLTAVENQTYDHDRLGRLKMRQDLIAGTSETFTYDALNRLSVANLTAPSLGTQSSSTTFNEVGNILSKTGVGTYAYPAPGSAHPHAVSGVTGSVNGVVNPSYSYDANGNMLTDGTRSFSWTSFNMPLTLAKVVQTGSPGAGTSTFIYGPEHQRTRQTWVDTGKTLTTYYLFEPHFEKEVNSQTGITEYKHYVKVGDRIVAILTRRSDGTEDVKYLVGDHLGSTSAVTDGTGAVVERQAFDPWGDRRVASGASAGAADATNLIQPTSTTRGFTGHEGLDQGNMGLVHMNGRVYDPTLARFLSTDIYIQDPYNSQSFSRYSYVLNAPLGATDPSGFITREESGNSGDPSNGCKRESIACRKMGEDIMEGWWNVEMKLALWLDDFRIFNKRNPVGSVTVGPLVIGERRDFVQDFRSGLSGSATVLEGSAGSAGGQLGNFVREHAWDGPGLIPVVGGVWNAGREAYHGNYGMAGVSLLTSAVDVLTLGSGGTSIRMEMTASKALAAKSSVLLNDGLKLPTGTALDEAIKHLGPGYKEIAPGVFKSADGKRLLRMTESDLTGKHSGAPHMNFEWGTTIRKPNGKETFDSQRNYHIFLPEE